MKPTILFISFILFFAKIATCQTKDIYLIAGGGYSLHGTGDMPGYNFLNEVDIQLNKHFFVSPGIQFTNNATTHILSNGSQLNYVTAGLNIFTNIQYLLMNKGRHRIAIGVGPVVRFENSSVPSYWELNRLPSGEQILLLTYDKLHTTSLGYNISPSYYYQCSKKMSVGAKFIFQNDTRGDVITSTLAFIGVKL